MAKKKKRSYAPQTRTILKFEKRQAYGNYKKGIAHGIILGSILTAILFVIFFGILN